MNVIDQKFTIPLEAELIISEVTILIPGLIWMLIHKASFKEDLGFKKIKVSTALMTILLVYLMSPLINLVNLVSQLFTENEVLSMTDDMINGNTFALVMIIGFFGPFCEEFIFRGIIGQGMKKTGSVLATAIVSGLFFGLMHMNLNQFCYAFVLGIIFQIVNHASGSIYTSIIMHMVFNTRNVILLLLMEKLSNIMGTSITDMNFQDASSSIMEDGYIYYAIAIFLVLAVVFTAVSIPVFNFIANNENHASAYSELRDVPDAENKTKSWYLNPWSITATLICVFVIFFLNMVLEMMGW